MSVFRYRVHGLVLDSAVALPELAPAGDGEPADVRVRIGAVVAETDDPRLVAVDDVARFLVSDGSEILVEPADGVDPRNVRVFLLGSAMGLLLHQRGLVPLHANAIVVDGRALAFSGPSGVGKSTLAAWCHDRGMPVLADDVCVIGIDGGRGMARPGLRRLRLWKDALARSGRDPQDYPLSFELADDEPYEKYDLRIDDLAVDHPVPLGAVAILSEGPDIAIRRLGGIAAAEALFANTYRGEYVAGAGDPERHFATCIALARAVPVLAVSRPRSLDTFDSVAGDLLERLTAEFP